MSRERRDYKIPRDYKGVRLGLYRLQSGQFDTRGAKMPGAALKTTATITRAAPRTPRGSAETSTAPKHREKERRLRVQARRLARGR